MAIVMEEQQQRYHAVDSNFATPPLWGSKTSHSLSLIQMLQEDIAADDVALPAMQPGVALRIQRGINRAAHGRRMSRLLAADPTMTAKLLRVACGSSRLGRPRSLPAVISCLGGDYTAGYIRDIAVSDLLICQSQLLQDCALKAWQQALRVSTIGYLLATLDGRFDPEEAALAGLMHNIGECALIGCAAREPLPGIIEQLPGAIQNHAAESGLQLARRWHLPASIQKVCGSRRDWYRDHDGPPDMADLILVAQYHAALGQLRSVTLPVLSALPAFRKLDLGEASPHFSLRLLEAANNALSLTQRQLAAT